MARLVSHAEANYRKATSERRCGNCSMFRRGPPVHCTKVEQPIRAEDTCKYFDERKGPVRT
jgi:hypothetical protein